MPKSAFEIVGFNKRFSIFCKIVWTYRIRPCPVEIFQKERMRYAPKIILPPHNPHIRRHQSAVCLNLAFFQP